MTLNETFNMVKDGAVQDRRYKTGEISEATGLQKQPDGSWAPPKSTKYGKVTTNKEGKVGIQQTLGKGSKFEEFANEKSASRALANLTAGYNTTERSKEDPHSDKARQVKHWDKEVEQIKKENKAERRAAHAAQFQKKADGEHRTDRQIARESGYSVYRDGESRYGDYREYRNGDDIIRYDQNGYDERAKGKKYSAMESGPGGKRRFFDTLQEAAEWVKQGSPRDAAPLTRDTKIRIKK